MIEEYHKNKSLYTGYIAKSQLAEEINNKLKEVSQTYRNYDRLTQMKNYKNLLQKI